MWSRGRTLFRRDAANRHVLDGPVHRDGGVNPSRVRTRVAQQLRERRLRASPSRLQDAGKIERAQIGNLIRGRKQNIGIDPKWTSDAERPAFSAQVDFRGPCLRVGALLRQEIALSGTRIEQNAFPAALDCQHVDPSSWSGSGDFSIGSEHQPVRVPFHDRAILDESLIVWSAIRGRVHTFQSQAIREGFVRTAGRSRQFQPGPHSSQPVCIFGQSFRGLCKRVSRLSKRQPIRPRGIGRIRGAHISIFIRIQFRFGVAVTDVLSQPGILDFSSRRPADQQILRALRRSSNLHGAITRSAPQLQRRKEFTRRRQSQEESRFSFVRQVTQYGWRCGTLPEIYCGSARFCNSPLAAVPGHHKNRG